MIKHIVLFKLKDQKDRKLAMDTLLSMKGKVEGLLDLEVGEDFLASERSYDIALITTHTDKAALEFYQAHPVHQPVKEVIHKIKEGSVAVDFEFENAANSVIKKRRSIRKYDPDIKVTDEQIKLMLEAAMLAPSACNLRPWEFVVLRDREKLDKIMNSHEGRFMMLKTAQIAIIVSADPNGMMRQFAKDYPMWQHDCGAATQNILLQAADLGLGTCWCGLHPVEESMDLVRQLCDISKDRIPFSLIAVGVPDEAFGSRGFYEESKVRWM